MLDFKTRFFKSSGTLIRVPVLFLSSFGIEFCKTAKELDLTATHSCFFWFYAPHIRHKVVSTSASSKIMDMLMPTIQSSWCFCQFINACDQCICTYHAHAIGNQLNAELNNFNVFANYFLSNVHQQGALISMKRRCFHAKTHWMDALTHIMSLSDKRH